MVPRPWVAHSVRTGAGMDCVQLLSFSASAPLTVRSVFDNEPKRHAFLLTLLKQDVATNCVPLKRCHLIRPISLQTLKGELVGMQRHGVRSWGRQR